MSKSTWIVIGVIAAILLALAVFLFVQGQQTQAAAPSSPELPAGGNNAAGIFATIWAGVGQVTGGIIGAATSNTEQPPMESGA